MVVVCDYASKYPKTVPLKSIDAEQGELVRIFARMGSNHHRELLTDCNYWNTKLRKRRIETKPKNPQKNARENTSVSPTDR